MPDSTWIACVLIMIGGAVGSLLRYFVQLGMLAWLGTFPIGTLVVNVLGCFAIGALNAAFLGPYPIRPEYRLAIVTGVLGGFTTFSAFGWETIVLAEEGRPAAAAAYVALSVVLGLAAVWAGSRIAQRIYGF
jgi:CrcB protein